MRTTALDIIAISETKLYNNSNYNEIQLPGYTFVSKNSLTQVGGVGIYVKINLIYKIRSELDLHNDHIEDIWVEVTDVNNTSFLVGALYSHPNNNTNHFGEIFENSINILNMESKLFTCLSISILMLYLITL